MRTMTVVYNGGEQSQAAIGIAQTVKKLVSKFKGEDEKVIVEKIDAFVLEYGKDIVRKALFNSFDSLTQPLAITLAVSCKSEAVRMKVIEIGGERIFEVKDEGGRSVASYLAINGSEAVQMKVIEVGGERIFEDKDRHGRSVARNLAWYGSEAVQMKIIEAGGEKIFEDKDMLYGRSVASDLAWYGSEAVRMKIIEVGGERIFEDEDLYGLSVASYLAEKGSEAVQMKIIEVGGERIFEVKDMAGRSVASYLAEYGSEAVQMKIIEVGGERIFEDEDKDSRSVASYLAEYGSEAVFVKLIKTFGDLKDEETALTLKVLNAVPSLTKLLKGEGGLEKLLSHKNKHEELPFIFDYIAELAQLNKNEIGKLAEALKGSSRDVQKAVAARGIFISVEKRDLKDLMHTVFESHSGNNLLNVLGKLPQVSMFIDSGIMSHEEAKSILRGTEVENGLYGVLVNKIGGMLNASGTSEDAKRAIESKPDFVVSLISFLNLYGKSAPNARMVLDHVMKAYFGSGIQGYKNFKFHGHELAEKQLRVEGAEAMSLIEKIEKFDEYGAVYMSGGSMWQSKKFETEILNFNRHKDELFRLTDSLAEKAKKELEGISASPELSKLISKRDLNALKRNNFGDEEGTKRKAIALINLENMPHVLKIVDTIMNGLNKNYAGSDSIEEIIESMPPQSFPDSGMLGTGEQTTLKQILNSLRTLNRNIKDTETAAKLALENAFTVLNVANPNTAKSGYSIKASFTFDPSDILVFGNYGASGAGNCQKSSSGDASLNQSLMSMLADSNQFMVKFSNQEGETLGFMQVHLLLTRRNGKNEHILLFEKPYTNQPDKEQAMVNAAYALAKEVYKHTGIKPFISYTNGERIDTEIPQSYVNRYIDFIGGKIGQESRKVTLYAKSMVEEILLLRIE